MNATEPDDRMGTPFRFEYTPGSIRFGRGSVSDLATELDQQGYERALVICGRTVGATPAVIDPVRDGLGDALAGVFTGTTPEKRYATAVEASEAIRDANADVVVGLGGGSSLDVAKAVATIAADDRWPEEIAAEFETRGTFTIADAPLPIVAIPTTLAGADLSQGAGLTGSPDYEFIDAAVSGGISDRRLMPTAVFYDPDLVATTPKPVLAASAMNGFDKGIETLYAATATPITDATASRGLRVLTPGLHELGSTDPTPRRLERVLEGIMLVQYGISRPDAGTLSLIHALGHGLTRRYDVQQGVAHAAVAPHALEYLFDEVDARRDLLGRAFGIDVTDEPEAVAAHVVDEVTAVRDALDLPARLRDIDGPTPADFPSVATTVLQDAFMANVPSGLDPIAADIEAILENAW